MTKLILLACLGLFFTAAVSQAYVEVAYSLGQVINTSKNILLVEVVMVDKTKNLIIYKKLEDIKGKHDADVFKHSIGKAGFHEREWRNVMASAEKGKKAVFFQVGQTEICTGTYWYEVQGSAPDWYHMRCAAPFLLRAYCGSPEKLADACKAMLKGEEVVVPCMQEDNRVLLEQSMGKMQLMKASLKRGDYNAKRDFVAFGSGDDGDCKTTVLLPQSAKDWKYTLVAPVLAKGNSWIKADFDDSAWRTGKAPLGWQANEIGKLGGTKLGDWGAPYLFRRVVEVPKEVLEQKGLQLRLKKACRDDTDVYLNGEQVLKEHGTDNRYAYGISGIELKASQLIPGKNLIAVLVWSKPGANYLYFDAELVGLVKVR